MNTASGSRIKTDLRDTAASISPFTDQFLADIGASTIDDALTYGANIEADYGDTDQGFENAASVNTAMGNTNAYRIRGMGMSTAVDFVESSLPQDLYNIDRAEISSGPNSILFGTGSPGGMVTLTSKRANLNRNTFKVTNEFGVWNNIGSSWGYYRANMDYNVLLMPKKMAFRVTGLYQDGAANSWRKWQAIRDRRINPTITFRPWKNTTINLLYETGRRKEPVVYALNASDQLLGWLKAGTVTHGAWPDRYILDSFNPPAANRPGTDVIGQLGANNNYFVLIDNDATMYNFLQAFQSRAGTASQTEMRLDPNLSSPFYSTSGPNAIRNQRFDRYQLVIDQRLGGLNLQLGYYHNKNNATARGPTTWDIALRGDPNGYINTIEGLAAGASSIKNPYANRLYMEDFWGYRVGMARNDVIRLQAEYTLNLKRWGRHRIIGNLEHSSQENLKANYQEIIVDEKGYAIRTPDTPVGKNRVSTPDFTSATPPANYGNSLIRRHYVDEGNFNTYYDSTWSTPMPSFNMNGHTYHSQYAFDNSDNPAHTKRQIDSITAAIQSYWFQDRLVTILGGRLDKVSLKREDFGGQAPNTGSDFGGILDNPADPRLYANGGNMAWHEHYFNGHWANAPLKTPFTYNAGIVWHTPLTGFSLYANTSSNRAAPSDSAYYTLPSGPGPTDKTPWSALPDKSQPPQQVGTTMEAGIMYSIPGSKNIYLRLTYFNTRSLHEPIGQNNTDIKDSAASLLRIYNAFNNPGVALMSDADLARVPIPPYGIGLRDSTSSGFEAELTAKPTKNITLRLTASYTNRSNENMFSDIVAFYDKNIPIWMRMANPNDNINGGIDYQMTDNNGNPTGSLYKYIFDQLYGPSGVRADLNTQAQRMSVSSGWRPWKFNGTIRYNMPGNSGLLKGLSLGGGVRYSDQVRMARFNAATNGLSPIKPEDNPMSLEFDPSVYNGSKGSDRGRSLTYFDAFVSYKRKLFQGRTTMTLQVNVKNVFSKDVITVGQYVTDAATGQPVARRLYINQPRTIRVTATFDF